MVRVAPCPSGQTGVSGACTPNFFPCLEAGITLKNLSAFKLMESLWAFSKSGWTKEKPPAMGVRHVRISDFEKAVWGALNQVAVSSILRDNQREQPVPYHAGDHESVTIQARAHPRVLKLARAIADLAGSESLQPPTLAEAPQ